MTALVKPGKQKFKFLTALTGDMPNKKNQHHRQQAGLPLVEL